MQKQEYESEVFAAQLATQERLKNSPVDDINENNIKESKEQTVLTAGKGTYVPLLHPRRIGVLFCRKNHANEYSFQKKQRAAFGRNQETLQRL